MKDKIQIFVFAVLLSVFLIIGFSACTGKSTNTVEQPVAYARTFINKDNQIWRKLDSANVAEIHYKARSESNDNT